MRTVTTEVFKFEELKPEIQEKVINDNRDINTDYDFINNDDYFKELLKENGLNCDKFYYDIYRQEFYMDKPEIINEDLLFKKANVEKELLMLYLEIEKDNIDYEKEVNIFEERGKNYFSMYINGYDLNIDYTDISDKIVNKLDDFIADLNHKLLKMAIEQYEELESDDAIKETLIINEYEYTKEGKRA